jgi:hypothetical protein
LAQPEVAQLDEIRNCTDENRRHRASGPDLIVNAIILWNTRRLERAVTTRRQTGNFPELRSNASHVVMKACFVQHRGTRFRSAPLPRHIAYLKRER